MPFALPDGRPAIMGVLNVTPDSFSDGGLYSDFESAVVRGVQMFEEGADIIDVGGESTRPGAEAVSVEEELLRTVPVVENLVAKGVQVSIDTSKTEVARACLVVGACVVNDVTSMKSDGMVDLCAESGCSVCLMHMQGEPRTMQDDPRYGDVVQDVRAALAHSAILAMEAGVARERIWVDPGIGFGKTVEHNLAILNQLDEIVSIGLPVMIGVSRKSFIGKVLGSDESPLPSDERLEGTLAAQVVAQMKGVRIIRTHDVKETVRASLLTSATMG